VRDDETMTAAIRTRLLDRSSKIIVFHHAGFSRGDAAGNCIPRNNRRTIGNDVILRLINVEACVPPSSPRMRGTALNIQLE